MFDTELFCKHRVQTDFIICFECEPERDECESEKEENAIIALMEEIDYHKAAIKKSQKALRKLYYAEEVKPTTIAAMTSLIDEAANSNALHMRGVVSFLEFAHIVNGSIEEIQKKLLDDLRETFSKSEARYFIKRLVKDGIISEENV